MASDPLHPTLWRTCRVIANHPRLHILAKLIQRPSQTVSAIAEQLHLPLPVASQYLRMLEARGLLTVRRKGRWVTYRLVSANSDMDMSRLVEAMRSSFLRHSQAEEMLFRLATAFTHPRRIEIYRSLKTEPQTCGQIQEATNIPVRALQRHLRKLESREFVQYESGHYRALQPTEGFGRELARLAVE